MWYKFSQQYGPVSQQMTQNQPSQYPAENTNVPNNNSNNQTQIQTNDLNQQLQYIINVYNTQGYSNMSPVDAINRLSKDYAAQYTWLGNNQNSTYKQLWDYLNSNRQENIKDYPLTEDKTSYVNTDQDALIEKQTSENLQKWQNQINQNESSDQAGVIIDYNSLPEYLISKVGNGKTLNEYYEWILKNINNGAHLANQFANAIKYADAARNKYYGGQRIISIDPATSQIDLTKGSDFMNWYYGLSDYGATTPLKKKQSPKRRR